MKPKKTRYCAHFDICDKEYDCFNGEFCPAFEHTKDFSSLRFEDCYNEDDPRKER